MIHERYSESYRSVLNYTSFSSQLEMESIRRFQKSVPYQKYSDKLFLESSVNFDNCFEFPEFVKLKANYYTEQDSLFQNIEHEEFKQLAFKYNPVTYIMKENKRNFEVFLKPWPKIYEILQEFKLISNLQDRLSTLHLGEEIGAMVCALNHYLKSNHRGVSR